MMGRGWIKAVPALLTVLLLAPAPVLAFTWVSGSSWKAVVDTSSGGAPKPAFASTDGKNGSQDVGTLQIDMGTFKGATTASATIELQRALKITPNDKRLIHEKIGVLNTFNADLQNAGFKVKVKFIPVVAQGNGKGVTNWNFSKSAGNKEKTIPGFKNPDKSSNLKVGKNGNNGQYIVDVTITYSTKGKKSHIWADPSKTASSHTLVFHGI